ncbi:MAG TPA: DUF5668 domain-containing protein [Terriglobales bacterium]|nr:DUF5668 domain-containing protein [Terriglobales bacterium]
MTPTAFCRTCGRPLNPEEQRDIYGVIYCQDCLLRPPAPAAQVPGAAVPPAGYPANPHAPNPGIALCLGFIPGVGAIYNGQYLKAFVQVVVFCFLIAMANSSNNDTIGVFTGLGIAAFYFYMVIDSYRSARAIQSGIPVEDFLNIAPGAVNAPVAAIVLIAIGAIFLLRSLGFFYYDFSRYFWPVILIAVGVYLLLRHNKNATPAS